MIDRLAGSWRRLAAMLRELVESTQQHERAHGHYGNALGWLLWLLLLALALTGARMSGSRPLVDPACRTESAGGQVSAQVLRLELAGHPDGVRRLLAPAPQVAGLGGSHTACVEDRAAAYVSALRLDNALFIPLYLGLALVASGWLWAMGVRVAATTEATGAAPQRHRAVGRWMLGSLLAAALTAGLDARENDAAIRVLEHAMGVGALDPPATALAQAAEAARSAALHKWLATGLWMGSLAWLFWRQRDQLSALGAAPWRRRGVRVLVPLLAAVCGVGALALTLGAIAGLAVGPGPGAAGVQLWVGRLIGSGFYGLLGTGAVLALLDSLRRGPQAPRPATVDAGEAEG